MAYRSWYSNVKPRGAYAWSRRSAERGVHPLVRVLEPRRNVGICVAVVVEAAVVGSKSVVFGAAFRNNDDSKRALPFRQGWIRGRVEGRTKEPEGPVDQAILDSRLPSGSQSDFGARAPIARKGRAVLQLGDRGIVQSPPVSVPKRCARAEFGAGTAPGEKSRVIQDVHMGIQKRQRPRECLLAAVGLAVVCHLLCKSAGHCSVHAVWKSLRVALKSAYRFLMWSESKLSVVLVKGPGEGATHHLASIWEANILHPKGILGVVKHGRSSPQDVYILGISVTTAETEWDMCQSKNHELDVQ